MKILNAQELIRLLANPSEIDNFSDENYCANQNVILDDTNGINLCCQQNLTLSSISFLKTFIYKAFPKNIEKYLKLYRLAFCNNNCSSFEWKSVCQDLTCHSYRKLLPLSSCRISHRISW